MPKNPSPVRNQVIVVTTRLLKGGADNLILALFRRVASKGVSVEVFAERRSSPSKFDGTEFFKAGLNLHMPSIFSVAFVRIISVMLCWFPLLLPRRLNKGTEYRGRSHVFRFGETLKASAREIEGKLLRCLLTVRVGLFHRVARRASIIHAFHYSTINTGATLKHRLGVPAFYTEISSPKWREEEVYRPEQLEEAKEMLQLYDRVFVPSENTRREFNSYDLSSKIVKVPFFVDMEGSLGEVQSKRRSSTFGMIGRFIEQKNQEDLIRALHYLRFVEGMSGVRLVLAGSGERYYEKLVTLAEHLGVTSGIEFYPGFSSEAQIMNKIDVYVSLSVVEGLSLALLEALYFSKPIIAFNVGATADLVRTGYNGYLLEQTEAQVPTIAQRIRSLLEDEATLCRFSKNSHQLYVASYLPDRNFDKYYQYYVEGFK